MNAGNLTARCNLLDVFIADVQKEIGKTMTASEANELVDAAKQMKATLGCP